MFLFYLSFFFLSVLSKLLGVVEISRTGATSPLEKYSWDNSDFSTTPGALTNYGIAQHYILGQHFRDRYISSEKLLSETFDIREIYVRTIEDHSSQMSAHAQLLGLYPKTLDPHLTISAPLPFEFSVLDIVKASFSSIFRLVPVEIIDKPLDFLLYGPLVCPKMEEYLNDALTSEELTHKTKDYNSHMQQKLQEIFNINVIEYEEAGWIGNVLETIKVQGKTLPLFIDELVYEELLNIRDYANSYLLDKEAGVELAAAEMYKEIVKVFQDLINNKSMRKFNLYVTHDLPIIAYLKAIRAWDYRNPPFASTLVFELHSEDEKETIKVFYNGEKVAYNGIWSESIDFYDFKSFVESWTPTNVHSACQVRNRRGYILRKNKFYGI